MHTAPNVLTTTLRSPRHGRPLGTTLRSPRHGRPLGAIYRGAADRYCQRERKAHHASGSLVAVRSHCRAAWHGMAARVQLARETRLKGHDKVSSSSKTRLKALGP